MNFQCRIRFLALVQYVMYGQPFVNKCYCCATVPCMEYFLHNNPSRKTKPLKAIIKSSEKNGLDSFAENVVQRFVYKQESKTCEILEQYDYSDEADVISISNFSEMKWNENNVNNHLVNALRSSQFVEIRLFLVACYDKKILPSRKLMLVLAFKCALKGEVQCIQSIQNLCKLLDIEEYENQNQYELYLAGAMWMKGNIEEGEVLLWTLYNNNQLLHGKIKYLMKILITHALSKKGEAALVLSMRFARKIYEEFKDYTFFVYIWEHCILSDWFCDNQTADNLLEEIADLQEAVPSLIPDLIATSLHNGKVDAAQRLCEVLLKYDKKDQFCLALRTLFDYSCLQGDERACLAIIESSRELNIPLTEAQQETFLLLFCNENKKKMCRSLNKWPEKPPKFNLKF